MVQNAGKDCKLPGTSDGLQLNSTQFTRIRHDSQRTIDKKVAEQVGDHLPSLRLLSVNEVADLLAVSVRTVWRLLSTGRLPQPIRIGGGRIVRWRHSDLQAFIAEQAAGGQQ